MSADARHLHPHAPPSHQPRRGFLMMVVAPSGVGKTSLTRRLVADHQDLQLSISYTTRDKRPGEQDERDYFFTDRPSFDAMVADNAFLEWAEVYGQRYGSPRAPIMGLLEQGESVLFDIDLQGAASIRAQAPEDSVCVYLLPPSLAEMRRRLHARSQDTEETIHKRLERAKHEIVEWESFDYVLVNENFDAAYAELAHIYHAERSRRARNPWISTFVADLLDEGI